MKTRTLLIGCALLLGACDEQEAGKSLPAPTGEDAPALAEIGASTTAGEDPRAHQSASHRWVGSVRAKQHVELAPGMTGVIADIAVEEGDRVEAGQQVFRIEGAGIKLAVSQAQAAVASAELQLSEAEREAERTRKLAERGSVGAASLERAQAGVEAARAGVKQAKAATALARSRTSDLTVESPISGIVTAKYKNVGEVATMMPPTVVLVIDDLSTIEVRVRVPELKLREIDVGSSVTVYFPALDHELDAPITRIGNSVDPRTRTIELIIDVQNPELRIKSGMSVEIDLPRSEPPEPAEPSEPAPGEAPPSEPGALGSQATADAALDEGTKDPASRAG